MKKKLSFMMVALVALAAFATTMSLKMSKRAVSELTVISEATTWDFSSDVTLSSAHSGDLKYTGDDKTTEHIYANIEELSFAETFKSDALAFTGEYPFRSNSKKFAQNGTLHFKTSVAGKIVVKFSDTGSSASATAVKRYLVVNGEQTTYWASRENNGEEPYAAQLNVTTDEIEVPAGDVTIAGSSSIIVSYVSWAPNATPEPADETTWEVASSIAADDVVVLAYADGDTKKELNAIEMYGSNSVGAVVDYTGDKPAAKYPLTVVAGSADGSVAFKTTENKYLAWSSGNTLTAIDEVNANSSWTVTFAESVPTIVNVSDTNRKLQYNAANPRFCAYTSNQKALTIWKQVGGADPEPTGPQDIVIAPASGDIATALAEAVEGKEVKSITINLTQGVTYTVSAALVTPADFTINGNGATIDASALEANLIQMAAVESPTEWTKADVTISGVTVKGLKKALFYSTNKKYIAENFIIDNCVVEIAADATTIDYTKGSTAKNITVTNSTFYAPTATTKSFYSSQGGEKYTEYDYSADAMQTFTFTNNTMYNLAKSKNFFTHRQSNQKWMTYDVKNNIFVNCGKSGQTIKGMNGGSQGANPTWIIDNNAFNFDGADTSAAEVTGDADEPVKNSVAGIMAFTDAANGDFSGEFGIAGGASIPEVKPGDPRWAVEFKYLYKDVETLAALNALENADKFYYTGVAQIVAQGKAGENVYTYIKDESASSLIFDADGTKSAAAVVGRNIAANWTGDVAIVNGMFQLLPTEALTLAEGEAQTVEYPVVDFSYITAEHANEVVMLSGVTYSFVNNEDLTITKGEQTLTALNKFALAPGYATKDVEYNIVGAITVNGEAVEFWPIDFVEKPTVDIVVTPEDGTDISAAIDEASKGHFVRNITINLAAVDGGSAKYTITKPIEAAGSLTINGNGAVIDASALETPFVQMSTTPRVDPVKVGDNDVFVVDNIKFMDLNITGLKYQLFYANKVRYLVKNMAVENSVIAIDGTNKKTVFDFNGGGNAEELSLKNSTLWAEPSNAQNGGLYSSQSGQGAMELGGTKQVLSIQNSTLYNIASGKTTCSQRRNDVEGMAFILKNNIIVNCGKVGEFVAGLDGGSYKSKPTWEIENNAFNVVKYNEDGTFTSEDVSAKEDNKMGHEVVKNSLVGSVYFKDIANADFAISAASAAGAANAGDTRWGTWNPTYYNIAVSEDALQYADIAVQPTALEDEVVKVTVTEKNGFKMTELIAKVGAQTKLTVTDNSFIMPPANVGIDATFQKVAADYELAPAAGTDIAAALEGLIIRNLKLTLAEGGAYTLTKSIELGGNLEIIGNGAAIDASALEAPFINLSATPYVDPTVESKTDETTGETTETILAYPLDKVSISGVTIKGLSQQLVKSNNLYLVKDLTVDNSVVERLGVQKKSLFDFSGGTGGNVINLTVNKSTLYSDATTAHQNGDFFTSQSSKSIDQMGVDVTVEGFKATTTITNSTFYGIASGKTVSSLRKNSQAYMLYVVKNNVIVNSGKSGQFLKGLNAGQAGTDDNFDVDTNLFNFNDDVIAEQKIGSTEENIKNSVSAIVTFKDAAAGDFNMSIFKDPRIAELPAIGDPRWSVTGVTSGYAINVDEAIENGTVTPSKTWSAADETIKLTVTPDEGYELESITVKMGAAEIILEEDNSFIMPAADVTVSATFIAVPKLYIIGGPKDWNLADMTELKYNLETQTYELDYAPTATAYFAFADKQFTAEEAAAEGAWDVFNANNRLALGEGDIEATLNEPVDLKKVNGTIILKAGTYKISVTKDLKVTITGEIAPEPTEDVYIIAGSSAALLGTTWDGSNEANKLTLNETTGLWEKTYEGVALTKGTIEFKIVKNGTTWIPDGMGNNHTCEIPADGTYDVKVTFNPANSEKVDDYEMVATVATGINAITVDKLDNTVIYNLQGVRVEKSQAKGGVFIVNGKKMYLK